MRPSLLIAGFAQRANTRLRQHEQRWKLRRVFELRGIRVRILSDTNMADLHTLFQGYVVVLMVGESKHAFPLSHLAIAQIVYKIEPAERGKEIEVRLKRQHLLKLLPRADGGRGFAIRVEVYGVRLWENENESRPGRSKKIRPPIRSKR